MITRPLVLVADDERLIADTLVEILESEGFRAKAVSDGSAVIHFVELAKPDILLCDVMMPNMSGIEAAKRVRELIPDVPIILFSGQAAASGAIEDAVAEGHCFEVLAKPIKPELLISTIHKLLDHRAAESLN